jgi:tryptophanyl-tRNA synthetase
MAADILLYDANLVPVGRDQKQHVEMTRDIAQKFNAQYGETLVLPDVQIQEATAVVPGTDGQKMSKSYGNTIPLFATEAEAKKAIMGIVTDSRGMTDPKDPETCPIFLIHRVFLSSGEAEALAAEYQAGLPYGEAKKRLLATYLDVLAPARARRAELQQHPDTLRDIAAAGAAQARVIAQATIERVRTATGLR